MPTQKPQCLSLTSNPPCVISTHTTVNAIVIVIVNFIVIHWTLPVNALDSFVTQHFHSLFACIMHDLAANGVMPVITADSAAEMARKSHRPDSRRPRAHPLACIVDIQDKLMDDILSPDTEPRERAQCACAWEKLEDRKRILKGIGAPKPVDTTRGTKSKQPQAAPMEYIEPEQSIRAGPTVHPTDTQPEVTN